MEAPFWTPIWSVCANSQSEDGLARRGAPIANDGEASRITETPGSEAAASSWVAQTRRRPVRASLQAFVQEIEPGGRLLTATRLRGGISTITLDVKYTAGSGATASVVLRIYVKVGYAFDRESVRREWRTLEVVTAHGIAAPRPVWLDLEGRLFGAPAMAMSRLKGGPLPHPRNGKPFVRQLAEALAAIHGLPLVESETSHLTTWHREQIAARLNEDPSQYTGGDPVAEAGWASLRAAVDEVRWPPPRLVHDDYWPGNTVWYRGRLSGVVDWTSCELGDVRTDVAQCRVDLAMMYDMNWADAFLEAYRATSGEVLQDQWFWDLYRAVTSSHKLHFFIAGYQDLGLRGLALETVRARLEPFIRRALRDAPR